MFYKFAGYPPGQSVGATIELMLDVNRVSAYYTFGRVTVVRCDGADFQLTTPFKTVHNCILEAQSLADGLGDAGPASVGLDYRP